MFWFLYLCCNVFEDSCSHTATTRVYMPAAQSRIPDEEKLNSYGTINRQPQTFNFFSFFRVILFNPLREILKAWIFGSGEMGSRGGLIFDGRDYSVLMFVHCDHYRSVSITEHHPPPSPPHIFPPPSRLMVSFDFVVWVFNCFSAFYVISWQKR